MRVVVSIDPNRRLVVVVEQAEAEPETITTEGVEVRPGLVKCERRDSGVIELATARRRTA
jgi:hypothetical protein